MIHSNLLPKEQLSKQKFFGIVIEEKTLFRAGVSIGLSCILLLCLNLVLNAQINDLQNRLEENNLQIATLRTQTNDVTVLSKNVERLQQIDRDSDWLRRSGQETALRLAVLGNAIPKGAWFQHIVQDQKGWQIDGGAKSLDQISNVIRNISGESAGLFTSFSNVSTGQTLEYKLQIANPPPAVINRTSTISPIERTTGGFVTPSPVKQ